jgi:ubiquinone/menaquinone biosynthesis C-methylase UbiE
MERVASSVGPVAIPEALRGALSCPACGGRLAEGEDFECSNCGRAYAVEDGIPVLLPAPVGGGSADLAPKLGQATFFDEEASPEWEISRPHSAPAWHRWQLEEKHRRAISGLGGLSGMSALAVCGGSGMDAEFLCRHGAGPVVSADISIGAARRARERARRFNVSLISLVADVERLPFADRSFDLVFVHDGLHHLEDPMVGLREMARVARDAISVNEPARANATRMAVRTGLSVEHEEAGNRVARMSIAEIEDVLRQSGFEIVRAERYAMLYRHEPGAPTRILSRPGVSALARGGWRAGNAAIGRFGNKLTVQGLRAAP